MNPGAIALVSLKMMLREPLVLIWNLCFPLAVFSASRHFGPSSEGANNLSLLLPFVSYTITMNCIYGIGMTFVTWREDGFLRTFVHGNRSQLGLVSGIILGVTVLNVAFTLLMLTFYALPAGIIDAEKLTFTILGSFLASIVVGAGSVVINRAPFRWRTLSTFFSLAGWLMMMDSAFLNHINLNQAPGWRLMLSHLNPVRLVNYLLYVEKMNGVLLAYLLVTSTLLVVTGSISAYHLVSVSCERS